MNGMIQKLYEIATLYGLKILAALVIILVGKWIAKGASKLTHRLMEKSNIDPTIIRFLSDLTYIALWAFFIIAAIGKLGIQTTSFIAVIGAAGLAIGLALQGSLSNFAAGFLVILFRPFKVGDFIEGAGVIGTVEEVQIFTTTLTTPDNKTVIIPNAKLIENIIVNWTVKGTRRIDLVFGIGYDDNIDTARQIIKDALEKDERILKSPEPYIAVSELADSSVNFVVRPWVKSSDYWNVHNDLIEKIKKDFDAGGVTIPYPQRDVHLYQTQSAG